MRPFRSVATRYRSLSRATCALLAIIGFAVQSPALLGADSASIFRFFQHAAATQADQNPHPAIVRVSVSETNSQSNGSGSFVAAKGQHGLVVTNWHVVRDAAGRIEVLFPDGFRSAATLLKTDQDWDLAALLIWRPKVAPIHVSHLAPQSGEMLTIAGYGQSEYRAMSGKCTQYVAPSTRHPFEIVELAAQARQGDSGGPILNERGELAGVLFGASRGSTSGSFCGRVRWFLLPIWPELDSTQDIPPEATNPLPAAETPLVAFQPTKPLAGSPSNAPPPAATAPTPAAPRAPATPTNELDYVPLDKLPRFNPAYAPELSAPPDFAEEAPKITHTPPPTLEPRRADSFRWEDLAGTNRLEQIKAILAAIGLLTIWGHLAPWLTR